MAHPLVDQLYFARYSWQKALKAVSAEDAAKRIEPVMPIAWMIGHLASHEQKYWLQIPQGKTVSEAVMACGYGKPASNPPLDEMWQAWHAITEASNPYLESLTSAQMDEFFIIDGKPHSESIGTTFYHVIYHYWYHLGESQAVRQVLGHNNLPSFPSELPKFPYRAPVE